MRRQDGFDKNAIFVKTPKGPLMYTESISRMRKACKFDAITIFVFARSISQAREDCFVICAGYFSDRKKVHGFCVLILFWIPELTRIFACWFPDQAANRLWSMNTAHPVGSRSTKNIFSAQNPEKRKSSEKQTSRKFIWQWIISLSVLKFCDRPTKINMHV